MTRLTGTSKVKVGSAIAAIGGLKFIDGGAKLLPGGIATAVFGLGVVACLVVITLTVLRRGGRQRPGPGVSQRLWLIYWSMVVFEAVVITVGTRALNQAHHPELGLTLGALIVGMHFLPFAKAFGFPDFKPLAWTLMALGLIGGVLAVTVGGADGIVVVGVATVLSGVVMFAFSLRLGRTIATA